MEVNEEEDEVIVVEEVKQGEMRKQAPSSPPKMSRKRVHVAMEVDEEEEEEVIVVEEVKQGEMRKQAPSSPPKMSRKRVHVAMAMQPSVGSQGQGSLVQGSQAEVGQAGNMGKLCERCIKHWIACVVVRGGLRCNNCWAKHYGCSLVPVKEGVGGRGGPSGSQQAKAVVGSQTKGQARKARKPITLGK